MDEIWIIPSTTYDELIIKIKKNKSKTCIHKGKKVYPNIDTETGDIYNLYIKFGTRRIVLQRGKSKEELLDNLKEEAKKVLSASMRGLHTKKHCDMHKKVADISVFLIKEDTENAKTKLEEYKELCCKEMENLESDNSGLVYREKDKLFYNEMAYKKVCDFMMETSNYLSDIVKRLETIKQH